MPNPVNWLPTDQATPKWTTAYAPVDTNPADIVDIVPGAVKAQGTTGIPADAGSRPGGVPLAFLNQIVNGGLDIWQRGNGPFIANNAFFADRWLIGIAGTDTFSISKTTAVIDVDSVAAAAITFTLGTGGGGSNVQQQLKTTTDSYQLRGKAISLTARINSATAAAVRAFLFTDGTGGTTTYSGQSPAGGWSTLTVPNVIVPADATQVIIGIQFQATATVYLDNVMLVPGAVPSDYVPLPPADDFARCKRYYKVPFAGGGDCTIDTYQAAGANYIVSFPFDIEMAITPTMTKVGTWSLTTNCAQPTVTATPKAFALTTAVTALGRATLQNSGANQGVTAEANP